MFLFDGLIFAVLVFFGARLAERIGLPPLLGMIAGGVVFGAFPLPGDVLPGDGWRLQHFSSVARLAVLAVVLLRAGLGISRDELKRAGGLGLRLGILPLLGDAALLTLGAAWLLGLPLSSALVLGFLVAAISPAIVIPGLLDLLERDPSGPHRRTLTALLVAAPLDNILALVAMGVALDAALVGGGLGAGFVGALAWKVGVGTVAGLAVGTTLGQLAARPGSRLLDGGSDVVLLWGVAGFLVVAGGELGFSFVLAILAVGYALRARAPAVVKGMDAGLKRVWGVAQYALFGLIGAAIQLGPARRAGLALLAIVALGQLGRAAGNLLATSRSGLTVRERAACVCAFVPKATIQAAFAALALDRGLADGGVILTAGVLAVLITAPLGVMTLHRGTARLLVPGSRGSSAPRAGDPPPR